MSAVKGAERLAQRLGGIELFSGLDPGQLDWLAEVGRVITLADAQVVFSDGEPALFFYLLLEGGLLMTKMFAGQEQVLSRHQADAMQGEHQDKPVAANQFTGELPLLTGGDYVATATTLGPTVLVAYDRQAFFSMLERCPQISRVLLPVLAWRIHAQELQAGRSVMLAGLNSLAAGLAHELNNPISAALRGASRLRPVLADLTGSAVRWGGVSTPQERDLLTEFLTRSRDGKDDGAQDGTGLEAEGGQAGSPAGRARRGALAASDAVDVLTDWLAGLDDDIRDQADDLAQVLADGGVDVRELDGLAQRLRPELLGAALTQAARTLEAEALIDDLAGAAHRVEQLVQATKEYANLDRAPKRDVDLKQGLDAALELLGPQLQEISVHRRYAGLPAVPAFPSEINQVWTSLIQNAIDALQGRGDLTVATSQEGGCAVVEIQDCGPGIDPDVLALIFQPFFTTKDAARNIGLGLHLSRETLTRHGGSIEVTPADGPSAGTRVTVRLPLKPDRPGR